MGILPELLTELRSICLERSGRDSELCVLCLLLTPIEDSDRKAEDVRRIREWFVSRVRKLDSFKTLPLPMSVKLSAAAGIKGHCVVVLDHDGAELEFGLILANRTMHAAAGWSSEATESFERFAHSAGNLLVANELTSQTDGLKAWLEFLFKTAWGTNLVNVEPGSASIDNLWAASLNAVQRLNRQDDASPSPTTHSGFDSADWPEKVCQNLTPQGSAMLRYLWPRRNQTVSFEELLAVVWRKRPPKQPFDTIKKARNRLVEQLAEQGLSVELKVSEKDEMVRLHLNEPASG